MFFDSVICSVMKALGELTQAEQNLVVRRTGLG